MEHRRDQRQHVAADGVLERVQLDAADAVAEIDERSAGVGADHAVGSAEIGDAGVAGVAATASSVFFSGWKQSCTPLDASRLYQVVWPAASRASTRGLTGSPSAFMRLTVEATPAASHISNGPSSQLKPARMARSMEAASPATSPMRSAAVVPQRGEKGPEEGRGLVLGGIVGEQQAQAFRQRGGVLGHFEGGQSRLDRRGGTRRC